MMLLPALTQRARAAVDFNRDIEPILADNCYSCHSRQSPKVKGVERLSKPGKRVYTKVSSIRPVRQGYGIMVISTPKGVMTDKQARKEKVGGEALFKIW